MLNFQQHFDLESQAIRDREHFLYPRHLWGLVSIVARVSDPQSENVGANPACALSSAHMIFSDEKSTGPAMNLFQPYVIEHTLALNMMGIACPMR